MPLRDLLLNCTPKIIQYNHILKGHIKHVLVIGPDKLEFTYVVKSRIFINSPVSHAFFLEI